jgi:hypothetical protein
MVPGPLAAHTMAAVAIRPETGSQNCKGMLGLIRLIGRPRRDQYNNEVGTRSWAGSGLYFEKRAPKGAVFDNEVGSRFAEKESRPLYFSTIKVSKFSNRI